MKLFSLLGRLCAYRASSLPWRPSVARRSEPHVEELEKRETPSAAVGVYALMPAYGSNHDTNIPAAILSNPNVDGIALRAQWDALEPSEGAYDWITNPSTNYFDTQISKAAAANKKVSLSVVAGIQTPAWVFGDGAKAFASTSTQPVPMPWDSIFEAKWHDFVTALGNHFANNPTVVQVKITGINDTSAETALPDSPSDVTHGYTMGNVESTWATIAGYFATAFPTQQLAAMVKPGAFPTLPNKGDAIPGDLIRTGSSPNMYGGRFVAQNNALSDFFTYSVVTGVSTTVTTGYQMLWSATNDTTYRMYYPSAQITQNPMPAPPLSLDQILLQAVDNGVSNNAKFLEIYKEDIIATSPAALAGVIANAHARLNAHFRVSVPVTITAGSSFSVTVTAVDANNNPLTNYQSPGQQTLPGYVGAVHFTSSDGQALLPADYTFVPGDNGTHTFSVTLKTAGAESLAVTDLQAGAISGSVTASVNPAATSKLLVTSNLTRVTAGAAIQVTVRAVDAYGNTTPAYTGTVHFTSTDARAALPGNYRFTAADQGVHKFTVAFRTAGTQTVTVTDTVASGLTGTTAAITVVPGAFNHFLLIAPTSVAAGTPFSVTVKAVDSYGNLVTTFVGPVQFTSTDAAATLPPEYQFGSADHGVHTFTVTLRTKGLQTLRLAWLTNPKLGGSANILVQ